MAKRRFNPTAVLVCFVLIALVCISHARKSIDFVGYVEYAKAAASRGWEWIPYPRDRAAMNGDYYQSPFATLVVLPFTWLSFSGAKLVWAILNIAGVAWVLRKWLGPHARRAEEQVFLLMLFAYPLSDVFLSGNLGFLAWVLFLAAMELVERGEKGATIRGSFLWAFSTLIRIWPGVAGLYLLLRRNFRALAWGAVGVVLCLATTWIVMGATLAPIWWERWVGALGSYTQAAGPARVAFQSPPAALYRWLTIFEIMEGPAAAQATQMLGLVLGIGFTAWAAFQRKQPVAHALLAATFFVSQPFAWAWSILSLFPLLVLAVLKGPIPRWIWVVNILLALTPKALWPVHIWNAWAYWSGPAILYGILFVWSLKRVLSAPLTDK